jgi:signal transduction histidine kinase
MEDGTKQGTTLTISHLRDPDKIDFGKTLRNEVLRIVSPISGLDRGHFARVKDGPSDPGFSLELPDHEEDKKNLNLAEALLAHCYARVIIDLADSKLKYTITHKDGRCLLSRTFKYQSHISKGLHADIRYFPRRSAMFSGVEVRGWDAWEWVHENCGVGVVDHGFRIRPYGFEDDDWLHLQIDASHNRRDWRSRLMERYYPISPASKEMSKEKANPMLYLPNFRQLVGAVFVESEQSTSNERPTDLIPAINRQGYVDNEGYKELVEVVRTGMELLAQVDHAENRRLEQEKAKKEAAALRSDFQAAIRYIQKLPSLTDEDRTRITAEYSSLSRHLEKVEDYVRDAGQRMDTMALLGVMAGFMTHEARALIAELDRTVEHLQHIAASDQYVSRALPEITRTLDEFRGQIEYSALFIGSLQDKNVKPGRIPVVAQIEMITERFAKFVADRNISVEIDAEKKLQGPALPIAVYSGVLLNLYTNALKAVVGGELADSQRRIVFKAWNEPKWHILELADNGIGIPPNLRKRIWDPLFTTTSGGSGNPLGSGMGLGLSLVKEIVTKFGGRIDLVDDPPPGFSTCFKVQFPNT